MHSSNVACVAPKIAPARRSSRASADHPGARCQPARGRAERRAGRPAARRRRRDRRRTAVARPPRSPRSSRGATTRRPPPRSSSSPSRARLRGSSAVAARIPRRRPRRRPDAGWRGWRRRRRRCGRPRRRRCQPPTPALPARWAPARPRRRRRDRRELWAAACRVSAATWSTAATPSAARATRRPDRRPAQPPRWRRWAPWAAAAAVSALPNRSSRDAVCCARGRRRGRRRLGRRRLGGGLLQPWHVDAVDHGQQGARRLVARICKGGRRLRHHWLPVDLRRDLDGATGVTDGHEGRRRARQLFQHAVDELDTLAGSAFGHQVAVAVAAFADAPRVGR